MGSIILIGLFLWAMTTDTFWAIVLMLLGLGLLFTILGALPHSVFIILVYLFAVGLIIGTVWRFIKRVFLTDLKPTASTHIHTKV